LTSKLVFLFYLFPCVSVPLYVEWQTTLRTLTPYSNAQVRDSNMRNPPFSSSFSPPCQGNPSVIFPRSERRLLYIFSWTDGFQTQFHLAVVKVEACSSSFFFSPFGFFLIDLHSSYRTICPTLRRLEPVNRSLLASQLFYAPLYTTYTVLGPRLVSRQSSFRKLLLTHKDHPIFRFLSPSCRFFLLNYRWESRFFL